MIDLTLHACFIYPKCANCVEHAFVQRLHLSFYIILQTSKSCIVERNLTRQKHDQINPFSYKMIFFLYPVILFIFFREIFISVKIFHYHSDWWEATSMLGNFNQVGHLYVEIIADSLLFCFKILYQLRFRYGHRWI